MHHTERQELPTNQLETTELNGSTSDSRILSQLVALRKSSTLTPMRDLSGEAVIQSSSLTTFKLKSGVVLNEARIGFCVFSSTKGDPHKNVVALHPAFTGTARAKLENPSNSSQGDGWWSGCIGSGINPATNKEYLLNTDRYTVVCFDHFGGRKLSEEYAGSTSASELGSLQSKISLADGVNLASKVLAENFGIKSIKAVIGGSMGGGQAFEWLFQDNLDVEHIIDISGCSVLNPCAREYFSIQADFLRNQDSISRRIESLTSKIIESLSAERQTEGFEKAIEHILKGFRNYEEGNLPVENDLEKSKLFLVRQLGFLLFVTPEFFQKKHEKNILPAWLDGHGVKFAKRFDSEGLANICSMIASAPEIHPEKVIKNVRKKDIRITRTADLKDTLFPVEYQMSFNNRLRSELSVKGQFTEYYSDDKNTGHDRFLTPAFLGEDDEFIRLQLTKES